MIHTTFTQTAAPAAFVMPSCETVLGTAGNGVTVRDRHGAARVAAHRTGSHSWTRPRSLTD